MTQANQANQPLHSDPPRRRKEVYDYHYRRYTYTHTRKCPSHQKQVSTHTKRPHDSAVAAVQRRVHRIHTIGSKPSKRHPASNRESRLTPYTYCIHYAIHVYIIPYPFTSTVEWIQLTRHRYHHLNSQTTLISWQPRTGPSIASHRIASFFF